METMIAGINLELTEDGYLKNFSQWNKEVGLEIAKEEGITMTERHWDVIKYLQDQYKNEKPLSIRSVGKSGVVSIKEFYELFPSGPLKISSRVAGIPKPASCI